MYVYTYIYVCMYVCMYVGVAFPSPAVGATGRVSGAEVQRRMQQKPRTNGIQSIAMYVCNVMYEMYVYNVCMYVMFVCM